MRIFYDKMKRIIFNPICTMYIMLIVSFLSQISFLYEKMGVLRKLILVWGIVLLIYSVFRKTRTYHNKYSIVLLVFCVINCITVCLNYSNRFFYGVVTMAYVCIYLMIFFNIVKWDKKNIKTIENNVIMITIFLTLIFGIVALIMFAFNVKGEYVLNDGIIYFGMRENRLWGMYNSNTAATLCVISLVLSLVKLKENVKNKFLLLNIIVQLIYLILTQSRTGWIVLMVFIVLYLAFSYIVPILKNKSIDLKKKLLYIVCSLLILGGIYNFPPLAKQVLVQIPRTVMLIQNTINSEKHEDEKITLDRVDEEFVNEQDATNGRIELWKAAIEIVKDNPIFGIGSENIIEEAEPYLSETRYQNLVKGGFHNSYLAILVSSGILGILTFGIFLIMLIIDGLKYLWENGTCKYSLLIMLLFSLMVNELMEARWLYNTSFLNIIFWVLAGFVVYRFGGNKEKC